MKQKQRPSILYPFLIFCFLSFFGLSSGFSQSDNLRMSNSGLKSAIEFVEAPPQKYKRTALFPEAKRIDPPLPQLKQKRKAIALEAQKTKKIRMPSGTKIEIPENAFVDANGEIVTGQVDFYYEEYNSGLDIMLSGIPMDFKGQYFESAAMFDMRAAQNGEAVFPNPEAPIEVFFPTTPEGENFSFYNYDEEKGEWKDEGVEELLEAEMSLKDMWADALAGSEGWTDSNDYLDGMGVIVNPVLVPGGLTVTTLKPKSSYYKGNKRGLQFRFDFNRKANSAEKLSFSEWKKFNNSYWIFAGDQSWQSLRAARKRMNDLKFTYWPEVQSRGEIDKDKVLDCWLVADMENDCFNFMVATFSDTLSFPILPYQHGSNELQEQKRIKKMYRQYKEEKEERMLAWQEKMSNFYLITGDTLYKNGLWASFLFDGNNNRSSGKGQSKRSVPRRVKIKTFGLCNIDTILSLLGEEILVNCISNNSDTLHIVSSYIWNDRPRTTLFYEGPIIQLPARSGNRLLFKFKNGKIATVSEKEFQKAYKARKENRVHLVVTPIEEEEIENTKLAYSTPNR